jgi:hypothetical protein
MNASELQVRIHRGWNQVYQYGLALWSRTTPVIESTWSRLRSVDWGAWSVRTVGLAVVAGTLYLSNHDPYAMSPTDPNETVATRLAPVGKVTLASVEPRIAEHVDSQTRPPIAVN